MIQKLDLLLYATYIQPFLGVNHFYILNLLDNPTHIDTVELYKKICKEGWISKNFPSWIIDALGGMSKMLTYPGLEWQDHFMEMDGFIDQIKPDDVTDPIMFSMDPITSQVCLIIWVKTISTEKRQDVNVIFPYGQHHTWMWGAYGSGMVRNGTKLTRSICDKVIKPILNGKRVMDRFRVEWKLVENHGKK